MIKRKRLSEFEFKCRNWKTSIKEANTINVSQTAVKKNVKKKIGK
jgi:hypothetical protein